MAPDDTQCRPLRFLRDTLSIAPMHLKRHAGWIIAALVFAGVVLPFLVYYTGLQVFGAYRGGGPMHFLGDFYADVARLRPGAWLLLLGPATLAIVWRVLVAYAWPKRKGSAGQARG
jgi:hypothetical protein